MWPSPTNTLTCLTNNFPVAKQEFMSFYHLELRSSFQQMADHVQDIHNIILFIHDVIGSYLMGWLWTLAVCPTNFQGSGRVGRFSSTGKLAAVITSGSWKYSILNILFQPDVLHCQQKFAVVATGRFYSKERLNCWHIST